VTSVYLQGMVHAIRFDALRDKRACSFVEVADGRAATEPAGSPRPPRSQMPRRELCATPRAYQSVWRALVPGRFLLAVHPLLTQDCTCGIVDHRDARRRHHIVSSSRERALHPGQRSPSLRQPIARRPQRPPGLRGLADRRGPSGSPHSNGC